MLINTYALTATPLLRINYKPTGGAILSFRISRCNEFNLMEVTQLWVTQIWNVTDGKPSMRII